jgi:branched-chain amino acid transport system permease protein
MTATDFLNLLISSLLLAGTYAAMAVGMTIIYGVMKIVNLAHAGFLMLGAYFVYELHQRAGIHPLMGVLLAFPAFFAAGVFVHWALGRGVPVSDTPTLASLLLMFGLWLVLQNIGYLVWGTDDRSILTPMTFATIRFGEITIPKIGLVVFASALVSLAALEFILHKTWFGRAIRALIQNRYACRIVGIPVLKTARLTFGLGIAFAGAAGGLLALLYPFSPDFGRPFLLRSFVIIVLGGLESFSGVFVGALILALVETFSIFVVPSSYQPAISFSLLVVALIVLPGGVAGLVARMRSRRAG